MLRSTVVAVTLVAAATACAPAGAHVKIGDNWLFTGSTYNSDQDRSQSPNRDHRSDPVNIIFRGPSGAAATIGRVMDHVEADWTDRRIPGRYPRGARMRPRDFQACTDPQFVWYRDSAAANSGGWTQTAGYMSTNGACTNQYHTRLIHSARHGIYFPGAEHQSEWVLSPIHHEHIRWDPTEDIIPGHEPDRAWDQVRRAYMHAMRPHCREWGWGAHPESATDYQDFPNSGTISRISFRHGSNAEECQGA